MGLLRAYKRLRHSRGFGVHSPSAYRLVREVIHPSRGYAYYAESALPRLHGPVHSALLFRLAVYLHPSSVFITGSPQVVAVASEIIRAACPSVKFARFGADKVDLLLCFGRVPVGSSWRHGLFSDRRHPGLAAAAGARSRGHLLRSRRAALLVDADVPFQVTDIKL